MGKVFRSHDVDYVVNFAAESHVDRSITDPGIFVRTNVEGTLVMLDSAKEAWMLPDGSFRKGKRYLQVSTDEVYGALGPTGFFTETTPLDPHSPYSASKASADLFVKAFHDTYGMPVVTTRCSNNYGPYQFPEKLIPLMINNCLEHRDLPVYGDGLQVRDWLYVEDHCRAIDLVLHWRPGRAGVQHRGAQRADEPVDRQGDHLVRARPCGSGSGREAGQARDGPQGA
jgi:dTDP-glucose 4,6-dehydratase